MTSSGLEDREGQIRYHRRLEDWMMLRDEDQDGRKSRGFRVMPDPLATASGASRSQFAPPRRSSFLRACVPGISRPHKHESFNLQRELDIEIDSMFHVPLTTIEIFFLYHVLTLPYLGLPYYLTSHSQPPLYTAFGYSTHHHPYTSYRVIRLSIHTTTTYSPF